MLAPIGSEKSSETEKRAVKIVEMSVAYMCSLTFSFNFSSFVFMAVPVLLSPCCAMPTASKAQSMPLSLVEDAGLAGKLHLTRVV